MGSGVHFSGSRNNKPKDSKTRGFVPPIRSNQNVPLTPCTLTKAPVSKVNKVSIEDRKLSNEMKLLNNELARQQNAYKRDANQLEQAISILKKYDQETNTLHLIDKWRGVSQGGMSYMLNSILVKIDKIGGYEELRRKELEAEKRKIDYQMDDRLQDEMDNVLESEEFLALPDGDQEEYKKSMQEKIEEMEAWKERELSKLDTEMKSSGNQEMTMKELSQRLKVDYNLVFPE